MIDVVAAVIRQGERYLLARRAPHKPMGGYWEFPGGKIEPGETPEEALARELAEEFGVGAVVGRHVGTSVHRTGGDEVRLSAYVAEVEAPMESSTDHDRIAWVTPADMGAYRLAPADRPLVARLEQSPAGGADQHQSSL